MKSSEAAKAPAHSAQERPSVQPKAPSTDSSSRRRFLRQSIRQAPLAFVPNAANGPHSTEFRARGAGFEITLEKDGLSILTLHPKSNPVRDANRGASAAVGAAAASGSSASVQSRAAGAMEATLTRLQFLNADPQAKIEGLGPTTAKANFLIGNDPSQWQRNLPSYSRVRTAGLYPGIDLIYYGEKQRQLEYDLVVAPGTDPDVVRLKVEGDRQASLDDAGNLLLDGKDGSVVLHRPMLYQDIDHGKKAIAGDFVQLAKNEFGFKHATYDRTKPLIIDPTLSLLYSTFMGGIHEDAAGAVVLDAQNNVYVTGITASQDFPVSANAFLNHLVKPYEYELNTFVMKFDSSGTLLFSTYLGGSGGNGALSDAGHPGDEPAARNVGIDAAGNIYVAGTTTSSDFPVTSNAYQSANTGTQVGYLAELSPDGSTLEYGSYFGGTTPLLVGSMARAANGQIYVAGSAGPGLPTTAGAYKTTLAAGPAGQAAFLSVFDIAQSGGKQLVGSTYYGTDTPQANEVVTGNLGYTMALDSKGDPWLVGQAYTNNLPTTANAYQPSLPALNSGCGGASGPLNSAGYIAEFNPSLTTLQYASYLSGVNQSANTANVCSEYINGLALDGSDNIYVDGATGSSTFPVTAGALQTTVPATNSYSEFVAKLNAGGATIDWATYLGGAAGSTFSGDLTPDAAGNVWAVGITQGGSNFPISANAYQSTGPANSFAGFIDEISADGSKLVYGTYFGGSSGTTVLDVAVDANENVYVTGSTTNTAMPVTADALQPLFANGNIDADNSDAFFSILGAGAIGVISPIVGGNTGDTTITVSGAGFEAGATCSLVQGSTVIVSIASTVNSSGTSITCSFALNGAAIGSYDVVITNSNGSTFTKLGAFAVQSGGQPDLSVSIIGRPIVRTGEPSTFYINVTNSGSENAYFVPLWITLPTGIAFSVLNPPAAIDGFYAQGNSDAGLTSGTTQYISLVLEQIGPGQTQAAPLQITSPSDSAGIAISAVLQSPWFSTIEEIETSSASPSYSAGCMPSTTNSYALDCSGPYSVAWEAVQPFVSIDGNPPSGSSSRLKARLSSATPKPEDTPSNCPKSAAFNAGYDAGYKDGKANPHGHTPNPNFPIPFTPSWGNYFDWQDGYGKGDFDGTNNLPNGYSKVRPRGASTPHPQDDSGSCQDPPPPPPNLPPTARANPQSGGSIDPNFKSGPTGDGSARQYVRGSAPLTYDVGFENEPTATLPAATVVVTDQLDPAKVDVSTVSLGNISFGGNTIGLPSGTNIYSTTYTPPGVTNYVVKIQGSLDSTSGLLKWTFQTIDPTTGLPPTDPTVGFLPPDTDGIVGQGSVLFNVMPKAGQSTGTQVTNNATVVFDVNAPISTPTWLNTLDVNPPASNVAALPATEAANGFTVSWSGTDVGSGIASYSVYVSDNGGAFTAWQTAVTTTSATYSGAAGHTYGFYSIATDNAGNVESPKSVADATTTFPGVTTHTSLTSTAMQVNPGASITLTATVKPASGTAVPTGTVTFLFGTTTLGSGALSASGVATVTTAALPIGSDTVTAQYSGDTNFAASNSTPVIITVNQIGTSVALSTSIASVNLGANVTFSASVTAVSGSGLPTGTMTFLDGATSLGTGPLNGSGVATYSTTSLAAGTHTISAQYGGDSTYAASTSASITETVVAPAFTLSASPSTITVSEGQSGNATLTLAPVGGFHQLTSFACSGLPSFSTCTFSPATLTPDGSNSAVTTTVTIATGVATAYKPKAVRPGEPTSGGSRTLVALLLLGLGGLFRARRLLGKNLGLRTVILSLMFLGLSAFSSIGCGGGNSHSTPKGTSTVTVTATAGAEAQTTTLTVQVQ